MPKKAIIMKDSLDRFYTKDSVAFECLNILQKYTSEQDLFVEPSAGGGAFFRQITGRKVGLDLSPECAGVTQMDWFDYDLPDHCVVVGNPPFGSRNTLSKLFVRKACTRAKVVAFVLPSSFRKETTQCVFPHDWCLAEQWDLPHNSFLLEGEEYHVPCVFQVWMKNSDINLRESVKVKATTARFTFTNKDLASHFVFGAAPQKIIEKSLVKPSNRGYYLSIEDESVLEDFAKVDWKSYANSSVSGGVAWYSKQEIINNFEELKNEKCKPDTKETWG